MDLSNSIQPFAVQKHGIHGIRAALDKTPGSERSAASDIISSVEINGIQLIQLRNYWAWKQHAV